MNGSVDRRILAVVGAIIADVCERKVAPQIATARGAERVMRLLVDLAHELPVERPAIRYARENAMAMREMETAKNPRLAAMRVALRLSEDPDTQKMLAQRFRNLRRRKIKTHAIRLRSSAGGTLPS